jgi:peptidoglycan/LPS O-acetylase OafA/YrhL
MSRGLQHRFDGGVPIPDTGAEESPTAGRIVELDSLRGLAALAVVVFHSNTSWLPFGWAAVDLFFVLSGYLITAIIIRHGHNRGFLRSFYIRRGLRIWPIYYLLIAVLAVVGLAVGRGCHWPGLPYALSYTQTFGRFWPESAVPFSRSLLHTWTLAIEEQFYLVWPAAVLLVGRRRLPLLTVLCVSGCLVARSQGVWWDIFTRCDGLALGALLAWCRIEAGWPGILAGPIRSVLGLARFAGLVALGFLVLLGLRYGMHPDGALKVYPATTILAFNLVWVALVEVVLTHAGGTRTRLLRLALLQRLGQFSYGVYLYHMPILGLFLWTARDLGFLGKAYEAKALSIVAAVLVAAFSWRFVEQPILALKRRHRYERANVASALRQPQERAVPPVST